MKKSIIGATVIMALCSTTTSAMQLGGAEDYNLELYGKGALSVYTSNANKKLYDYSHDNESFIGLRGNKEFSDGVDVIFKIESGYVGYEGKSSGFGTFDTYVGFDTEHGQLRLGRMKTALYELVDWPYTNPGLGRVFGWGGDVKWHQTSRMSNMIRYDNNVTSEAGDFNIALSVNRDDTSISESHTYSSRVTYNPFAQFKIHAGYEMTNNMDKTDADNNDYLADASGYVVGIETPISDTGFKFYAGYKNGEVKDLRSNQVSSQDAISIIGEYWQDIYGAKLGYAKNFDYKKAGERQQNTQDEVYSLQLMINKTNGFLPYARVGLTDAYNAEEKD